MAKAQTSELFNCTTTELFKIITDYAKYPEFLKEVKSCQVIKDNGAQKHVEYKVSLIKDFKYTLLMKESHDEKTNGYTIDWDFVSGDIFKTMKGYWKLADEAGKCRATYSVEATFGMFVPGPVANAAVSVNLPNMISSYHKGFLSFMANNDPKVKSSKQNASQDEKSSFLGEAVKKVFAAGVGAAFMTEEGVRSYLSELKLPKEAMNLILQGASRTKDEVTQRLTQEVVGIIQKIDFVKEFSKFAETHKFKISAEIEITKKENADKNS